MKMKEALDLFVDELLTCAVKEFHSTEQYQLLQEKLETMKCDCETMLTKDQQAFVIACFELIMEIDGQEEVYVYQKGFQDCVSILKWIDVLA